MRKSAVSVVLSNEALDYVKALSEYQNVSRSKALEICILMTKLYYSDLKLMETELDILSISDGRMKE